MDIFADKNLKPVKILNHGKPAKNSFKYGLELIAVIFLNFLAMSLLQK
jgi:hypothetical protein